MNLLTFLMEKTKKLHCHQSREIYLQIQFQWSIKNSLEYEIERKTNMKIVLRNKSPFLNSIDTVG